MFGSCPQIPRSRIEQRREFVTGRATGRMFTHDAAINWSLINDRLTLSRPGGPTLVYVPWHARK
jgi:hypothetical protein